MSDISFMYGTKCRCCGFITVWHGWDTGDHTQFNKHTQAQFKIEKSGYPIIDWCKGCDIQESVQDVVLFFTGTLDQGIDLQKKLNERGSIKETRSE
jgi:hypothetical protein